MYLRQKRRWEQANVLDIGPGKELALAKTLYVNRTTPKSYIAVDVSKLEMPDMFDKASWKPTSLFSNTDVCDLNYDAFEVAPNVITCFEVLEHVEPEHALRMLKKIYAFLHDTDPNAVAFISTPNWDPKVGAAANHVNEMRHEALGVAIEKIGFNIEEVYGTFASQKDIKPFMTEEELELMDKLKKYYDSNLVSNIFAPLFPQQSRNCIWRLSTQTQKRRYPEYMSEIEEPWTSSEHWKDLNG
tara:strand:- start:439 stop:1167 length:729 start_codon:yes stop_codon:yes gene_type:complete